MPTDYQSRIAAALERIADALESQGSDDDPFNRLLTAEQVAGVLSFSMKTIRRLDSDTDRDRDFPQPVRLRSPAGGRPLKRWRLSDIRRYGGLKGE